MAQADTLVIDCPAKLNLALSVGAPDAATGLHPIASWMTALAFADTLALKRQGDAPSAFVIGYADNAPLPGVVDWPLESDLAHRAHRLLEQHVGRPLAMHATLDKRIPAGAGLGGGSSDAAAMLVGINRLFDLGLSPDALAGLAAELGSDVIFLTRALAAGYTAALVEGFGEAVTPLPPRDTIHLALLLPAHHSPTGPVYRAFDAMRPDARVDAARVRALAEGTTVDPGGLFNGLAEPALGVTPPLRGLRDRAGEAAGLPVHVTGSGAAMFVIAEDEAHARTLAQRIAEDTGVITIATRTAAD